MAIDEVQDFAPVEVQVLLEEPRGRAAPGDETLLHGGAGIPPKRGCTHRAVMEALGGAVAGAPWFKRRAPTQPLRCFLFP